MSQSKICSTVQTESHNAEKYNDNTEMRTAAVLCQNSQKKLIQVSGEIFSPDFYAIYSAKASYSNKQVLTEPKIVSYPMEGLKHCPGTGSFFTSWDQDSTRKVPWIYIRRDRLKHSELCAISEYKVVGNNI